MQKLTSFKVKKRVVIKATKQKIWDILTNPKIIKQYLFGTEAVSKWEVGSELIFQGEYDGNKYRDHGIIKQFDIGKKFQYTYWSSFSGLEDKEENYHLITYEIIDNNDHVILKLHHENIQNDQARDHSDSNWELVMNKIKEVAENN